MSVLTDLKRLLREATGESKWDDYVAHCREHGEEPMTRREFERQRSKDRESDPPTRCC